MTLTRGRELAVSLLGAADNADIRRLVDVDPYVNVVVAERLARAGTFDPVRLGGDLIGIRGPHGLHGACFAGGMLLPVGGDAATWRELADHLGRQDRRRTSLVGPAATIEAMWPVLTRRWGSARLVRPEQPMLVLDRRPAVTFDARVRPALLSELDRYLPAAEAMFAEELGLGPMTGAARRSYRAYLADLVAARRAFIRPDRQGQVAFKAEIGAVSQATCQIQGVWVRPDLRGRGLGTAAVAAVIERALQIAPTVSLYVNDFNVSARRLYARLGMRQVATVATVMF